MFESGARVQVLRYGTLFAPRAQKLADLYKRCASLEDIPADERKSLEEGPFKKPLDEVWAETQAFFGERDPSQLKKAENPRHKLALIFRWYLGQASRWAIQGLEERRSDWSVFTGPAIGAFNDWVRGSWLEELAHRKVVDIAFNLLWGVSVLKRAALARDLGLFVDDLPFTLKPLPPDELSEYIS
jgi:PfaD family protein